MQAGGGEWSGSWVESERPCVAPAGSLLTPTSDRPGRENPKHSPPLPPTVALPAPELLSASPVTPGPSFGSSSSPPRQPVDPRPQPPSL